MTIVQLFLKGADSAEVSAELVKYDIKDGCLFLTTKEEMEDTMSEFKPMALEEVNELLNKDWDKIGSPDCGYAEHLMPQALETCRLALRVVEAAKKACDDPCYCTSERRLHECRWSDVKHTLQPFRSGDSEGGTE